MIGKSVKRQKNFCFVFIKNMKPEKVNSNQINCKGIKLSVKNPNAVKRITKYLELNGLDCVGKDTCYVNNSFHDKCMTSKYIREQYLYNYDEFSVLSFPWSQETYLISEFEHEQSMLDWVKEMDSEACINLMI